MKPEPRFQGQPKHFWANVRSISQKLGYTDRITGQIKVHTLPEMVKAMESLSLGHEHLRGEDALPTDLGRTLEEYFRFRAEVLNGVVEPLLMDVERAARLFHDLRSKLQSELPVPMNKQKGDKKAPAYLTGIVNMLVEAHSSGIPFDSNPGVLTTITQSNAPLRTLARRVDGCFPGTVNPTAVWEIKEYYYTTTFGSRVADGVYESLLDGYELEEIRQEVGIDVKHLLIVDAHFTWWVKGRSYLCRLIDMLHMGYVDEVLFGEEVVERLPEVVREWVAAYRLLHP